MRPLDPPRLGFPLAERASPVAQERIRADLACIVAHVAREDPHACAVILTGGFSRGEGSIQADRPLNDYDLVCVRDRAGGARLYTSLADRLSAQIGLHVDLLPIWRARLPWVGRKLFWLDMRLGGRVIAGDARALERLRPIDPAQLPHEETARLLGNRAAGLLLALPAGIETPDPLQRDLQATKAILAAMDATLLHEGRYAARLRDRLAMTRSHPDHARFAAAVAWKLRGGATPATWWDDAAACLLRAVDATGARNARDSAIAHAVYAARARRLRPHPSRAVREVAWDLLAASRWPHGPEGARPAIRRLGLMEATWSHTKARFFDARAMTLQ